MLTSGSEAQIALLAVDTPCSGGRVAPYCATGCGHPLQWRQGWSKMRHWLWPPPAVEAGMHRIAPLAVDTPCSGGRDAPNCATACRLVFIARGGTWSPATNHHWPDAFQAAARACCWRAAALAALKAGRRDLSLLSIAGPEGRRALHPPGTAAASPWRRCQPTHCGSLCSWPRRPCLHGCEHGRLILAKVYIHVLVSLPVA